MKQKKSSSILLFILFPLIISAQALKVTESTIDLNLKPIAYCNTSGDGGALSTKFSSTIMGSSSDLLWLGVYQNQPNNPGILSITSISSGSWNPCFTVRANGNVGIFNRYPSTALEIGATDNVKQLKINGNIVWGSDERLKDNIKQIPNSLGQIKQLQGVSYIFKETQNTRSLQDNKIEIPAKITEGMNEIEIKKLEDELQKVNKNKKNKIERQYYGFLAQDIEKVFPDLVYKDSIGMLSVDYIGLIPILVNALNEQQQQIEYLINNRTQLELFNDSISVDFSESDISKRTIPLSKTITDNKESAFLAQNQPNPFNQNTQIRYYLPESVYSAFLCFYDLQGKQIKQTKLSQRGENLENISASEFTPGIYLYALIADGKEVDIKRMILTE